MSSHPLSIFCSLSIKALHCSTANMLRVKVPTIEGVVVVGVCVLSLSLSPERLNWQASGSVALVKLQSRPHGPVGLVAQLTSH